MKQRILLTEGSTDSISKYLTKVLSRHNILLILMLTISSCANEETKYTHLELLDELIMKFDQEPLIPPHNHNSGNEKETINQSTITENTIENPISDIKQQPANTNTQLQNNLYNYIFDTSRANTSSNYQNGDIILFRTKKNIIYHAAIVTDTSIDEIIDLCFFGIDKNSIDDNDNNRIEIYRAHESLLRKKIAIQARTWYLESKKYKANNYRHKDYFQYLYFRRYINENDESQYRDMLSNRNIKTINLAEYLKFGLRQNTLPSLNSGFTCAGFVFAVIGSALIKQYTRPIALQEFDPYNQKSKWPTLKYSLDDVNDSKLTPAIQALNFETKVDHDTETYKNLLKHYDKLVDPEIEKMKLDSHSKIIVDKIPISQYLLSKGVNIDELLGYLSQALETLIGYNIRFSDLASLEQYLKNSTHWDMIP